MDQSPLVARRLGFASQPLAVLAVLIGTQSIVLFISMHADESSPWLRPWEAYTPDDWINVAKWGALAVLFWACFLVIKIILGVQLLTYATRRRAGMEAREEADKINDFGRNPIGEGHEEQVCLSASCVRALPLTVVCRRTTRSSRLCWTADMTTRCQLRRSASVSPGGMGTGTGASGRGCLWRKLRDSQW